MKNDEGFDRIAGVYDLLGKVVFGNDLINAQSYYLDEIKEDNKVLIIGGGSGIILEKIAELDIKLNICFVEASVQMLNKAKSKQLTPSIQMSWIHGDEDAIPDEKFDVVFTAFFLDLFPPARLSSIMQKLNDKLVPGGKWLFTDFNVNERSGLIQRTLIRIMYVFFRAVTVIKGKRLPDFEKFFSMMKLIVIKEKYFRDGMIKSVVYQKP